MREDFLHYLWRFGRFDLHDLRTTEGLPISIQSFGNYNKLNAGPDFQEARLRLGKMNWAGQVEMHLKSSDWFAHGHQDDPAYENVILHVVLEEDQPAIDRGGRRIPCLELARRIPAGLIRSYWRLMHNAYWIPCQNQFSQLEDLKLRAWLDRMTIERLEKRTHAIQERLMANRNDWEATFYERLSRSLGGRINDEAMEMLARSVPLKIALRHKNSLVQLEALFFGQSGLLQEASGSDLYVKKLKAEYHLLAHKYQLTPLLPAAWRYLRLRPNNFPTIRIAQLAMIIHKSGQLFSKILAAKNAQELVHTFDIKLSHYWRDHYRFDKAGKGGPKKLGVATLRSVFINAIAPIYYLYGQVQNQEKYVEKAIQLLEELPAEKNAEIKKWVELGAEPSNAADTQALLQLKATYCDKGRCLDCAIGCHLLSRPAPGVRPHLSLNEEAHIYQLAKTA
ncbi:MAG: DUF2851 family protein [Bacteroidota bacterium]